MWGDSAMWVPLGGQAGTKAQVPSGATKRSPGHSEPST